MRQAIKKIIAFIAFSVLVNTFIFGQWEILKGSENFGFTDPIDFVNDQVGWVIEGYWYQPDRLFKTTDFGKTWFEIKNVIAEKNSVLAFDFYNDTSGYILVQDNSNKVTVLLFTNDNGNTWQSKSSPVVSSNYIRAFNDSTILLDSPPGNMKITENGGNTWRDVILPEDGNIHSLFSTYNTIILSNSSKIYRTKDGGENWDSNTHDFNEIGNFQLINDSTIYFIGVSETDTGYLCKSTDTCRTWTILYKSEKINLWQDYKVVDSNRLFLKIDTELFLVEQNDFNNMQKVIGGYGYPSEFHFYFNTENQGLISSILWEDDWTPAGMSTLRSSDGGLSWAIEKLGNNFTALNFFNESRGFVAGSGGLFETTDGGENWKLKYRISGELQFVNDLTAYAFDSEWYNLSKTNDGGESWKEIETASSLDDYGFFYQNAHFQNEKTGWLAGIDYEGKISILSTGDGGLQWDQEASYEVNIDENQLYFATLSIHYSDSVIWIVGPDGFILKGDLNGNWQEIEQPVHLHLSNVFFNDRNHGWVVARDGDEWDPKGSAILKTEDGGISWETSELDYDINDIFFINNSQGWAIGRDTIDYDVYGIGHGVILYTSDGGKNWQVQMENLPNQLNAIQFRDGFAWAVGDNGLILKTTDKLVNVEELTNEGQSDGFILNQTYPNPFTDKTTISYTLSVRSHVDLNIYNLLGQRLAGLVAEEQVAGTYQLQWDASAFPSGIYILYLSDGKHIIQKKIIKK